MDQARTECETGFQRRHSGEGSGDCRVVAVGAVPAVFGGNFIYNGSGQASPTGTGGWYDNWNEYVAPNTYKYAGTQNYRTSDGFSDHPSNSVDAIMRRNVEASSKPFDRGDRTGQVPASTTVVSFEREHAGCGDVGPVG